MRLVNGSRDNSDTPATMADQPPSDVMSMLTSGIERSTGDARIASAISVSLSSMSAIAFSSEPTSVTDEAATLLAVPPAATTAVRSSSVTGIADDPTLNACCRGAVE